MQENTPEDIGHSNESDPTEAQAAAHGAANEQPTVERQPVDAPAMSDPSVSEQPIDTLPIDEPQTARTPPHGRRLEIASVARSLVITGGAPQLVVHLAGAADGDILPVDRDGVLYFGHLDEDDVEVQAPHGTTVVVQQVGEDLRVQSLDGVVEIERVLGDVEVQSATTTRLGTVQGDLEVDDGASLEVREVAGDVDLDGLGYAEISWRVRGDLTARDVATVVMRGPIGGDASFEHCGPITVESNIGGDLDVEQCAGALRAGRVGGEASVRTVSAVTLGGVGSDARIERCAGPVEVGTIGGDARFVDVGDLRLSVIGGDGDFARIGGYLHANKIGGDAEIEESAQEIHIAAIGGDLDVHQALAGITVESVGGDAMLHTPLNAGANYSVSANGEIELHVVGDVNARFVAQSTGGEIRTQLPLTVERGRRRNLVGVLGRGDATVTLRSDGDIEILAVDAKQREYAVDDSRDRTTANDAEKASPKSWEGSVGGKRFRVSWDRTPDRANVQFEGPMDEGQPASDAPSGGPKNFVFEWERGKGARTYGDYDEQLRDLGTKAERLARRAAEQAQEYAEKAAKRTRETDWEAVGREARSAINKAMAELEETFGRMRSGWDTGAGSTGGAGKSAGDRPGAQRVRIEQDEADAAGAAGAYTPYTPPRAADSSASTPADREAQRRSILEQLRTGAISLDDAERRLNDLR